MALQQENALPQVRPQITLLPLKKRELDLNIIEGDEIIILSSCSGKLIDGFTIEEIKLPDLHIRLISRSGRVLETKEEELTLGRGVRFSIPAPVSIVRTARGYRVVSKVRIKGNYTVYTLEFLKYKKPNLYKNVIES